MGVSTLKAEDILFTLGTYKSRLHFFFCVYLAQKMGILPHLYEFDFSMNIPSSSKLESEVMALFGSEKLVPHNGHGTYRINHSKIKQELNFLRPGQTSALRELHSLQTGDLIKIALLLPSLPNSVSRSKEKASKQIIEKELMLEPGEAERIYHIFLKIESFLHADEQKMKTK